MGQGPTAETRAESYPNIEDKANLTTTGCRVRGPQTCAVDRGEHPRCPQARSVRWREKNSSDNQRNRGRRELGRGNHEGD
jgi:hypothetical protein